MEPSCLQFGDVLRRTVVDVIEVPSALDFFFIFVEECVEDVYHILVDFAGQYFIHVFAVLYLDVLIAVYHVRVQQFLFC